MRHAHSVRVGPVSLRVGSDWASPIAALRRLYAGYPAPDGPVDHTVRLQADRPWRRWVRPSVRVEGDEALPDAQPLALAHGLLAAEMGMNLQLALGHRRHLLLHASWVESDGSAVLMTGESGSGKSTLAALLAERGWRFGADEFALIDPATGLLAPFPRPISLKNEAVGAFPRVDPGRWGPILRDTPKGTVRHLRPPSDALARMDEPARPVLILFPTFGEPLAERPVGRDETFVRLTQASTNYVALGRAGFDSLTRLVLDVPAIALDYPDGESGVAAVERLMVERT